MLPSHSEPNVLDESQGLLEEGTLSRVASVQSEPGHHNLLLQPPLGRKRGLRQVRRPLLTIPRMQDECRGRQGARLSTTRRSIQPKTKAVDRVQSDQKRSVTFTKSQEASATPTASTALLGATGTRRSSHSSITNAPTDTQTTSIRAEQHTLAHPQASPGAESKDKGSRRCSLSPTPCSSTPASRSCSPLPSFPMISTPVRLSPAQIRESPEDEETSGLLENTDPSLQMPEDHGTENPLLSSLLTPHSVSLLPLSPVDLDLDESHV